jgi:hypothetical protein
MRLAFILLVLTLAAAHAEPERVGYAGASAGAVPAFYAEASIDGGWRVPELPLLWLRGRLLLGVDSGDFLSHEWTGAVAGFEVRTRGRGFRGVAGVEAGVAQTRRYNEGELERTDTGAIWSWHLFGELGDGLVFRFGLQSSAHDLGWPLPTLGFVVRF